MNHFDHLFTSLHLRQVVRICKRAYETMTTFESLLQLFPFEHCALKVFKSDPNSYPYFQRRDRRHHVRSSFASKIAVILEFNMYLEAT